ncbi:MAG: hypothetical protein R3B70_41970 [Polyangiaceae bacterium]
MSTQPLSGGFGRFSVALLAVLALTMLARGIARAQSEPLYPRGSDYHLEFHALADPTCPTEKDFREEVRQICGHDVLDPQGRHVLRVVVRKGTFYQTTVELFLPDGSRHSDGAIERHAMTCKQAMREAAVALVGFIPFRPRASTSAPAPSACDEECRKQVEEALERGRAEGRAEGRREGRAERDSEIREELDDAIVRRLRALGLPTDGPPRHARRMPTPLPFAVSASGLISIGFALDVAPGFALGAEWRPIEHFSLGVEARAVLPAVGAYYGSNEPRFREEVSIYSALVSPCARISYFVGCGALDVGGVYAPGGPTRQEPWAFRLAAGPRIGADFPFAERFSVRVLGDLLFPCSRFASTPRIRRESTLARWSPGFLAPA